MKTNYYLVSMTSELHKILANNIYLCTYLFEKMLSFELEVSKSDNLLWLRILRRICVFLGLHPSGDEEGLCEIAMGNCWLVGEEALDKLDKICVVPICLLSSFWSDIVCENSCPMFGTELSFVVSLFPLLRFLLIRLVAGDTLRFLESDPSNND